MGAGRYSLGQRTVSGTAAEAAWELIAGARGVLLKELSISMAAATASIFGLGRPAAKGVTPTTPVLFQSEKTAAGTALASGAMQWGTKPTVPAAFFRRIGLPAAVGESIRWDFGPRGLIIPASASLVVWNIGTNGVADVYAVIEE